ncbi:MAG: phosphopantetheine-binding protein [Oscillospiraceae bacterium]|nr:phosphopantetheine-binding protein [Oscillospiraceae bacterium]
MKIKETLLSILGDLHPEIDFENEDALVTDGVLDSFDIVSLVAEINSEFDITVGIDELEPENFDSVDAMEKLVESLLD